MSVPKNLAKLLADNQELTARLEEAEELLAAIRTGAVDALLVEGPQEAKVYTLQGAEQTYRVFVESMNEGAATLASDGTIVFCNQRFAELAGASLQETLGRSIYDFVGEIDEANVATLISQATDGSSCVEAGLGATDDAVVPVRFSARRLPPTEGQCLCLIATDLRGQKLREKLAEQDRRKDEFLAMLGHELRNPLAVIHNAIQVLHRRDDSDPTARELRIMIEEQTQHMGRMIDDLLDVSRLTMGKIRLEKSDFDLTQLLARTAQSYKREFDENGVLLDVRLPDKPVYITADRTRLAQTFGNLLHNSNKFTDRGGHVTLTLSVDSSAQVATIAIRDSGIGMTPETLQRIFETFSQADSSLERSGGGLGLGLALVKGLVDLHGGRVEAKSEGLGKGSELVVRLPMADFESRNLNLPESPAQFAIRNPKSAIDKQSAIRNRPSEVEEQSEILSPATSSKRILIIEDNRDGAVSMQILLTQMGHQVEVAFDGPDGLAIAPRFNPEVVLCDIGLPGLDGYQIARELRQRSGGDKLFLLAISGYGQEADKRRALEAGFDLHYVKPLQIETLEDVLAKRK